MFALIILVAAIWIVVYLIELLLPTAQPGKTMIRIIAAICTLFIVLKAFGLLDHDVPLPKF